MWKRIRNRIYCSIIELKNKRIIQFSKLTAKGILINNQGRNNHIQIQEHCNINNCRFLFKGSNNSIEIHSKVSLNGVTFWIEDDNNRIIIGENCTFEEGTQLAACEGTEIFIGNDCMFSNNISVRTTDSHSILNSKGDRTNNAANIHIGNHIWIGLQALILKGARIENNCIIGARAVISSSTPNCPNSLIAGFPAKIIRKDTSWCRERI